MDLSKKEKLKLLFKGNSFLKKNKKNYFFHVDCKFSKKKFCGCCLFKPNQIDFEFADLIDLISSKRFKIDLNKKEFLILKDFSFEKNKEEVINEKINMISIDRINQIINEFDGNGFSSNDFKKVYTSILSERKFCENCKTQLNDNNYQLY